MNTKKLVQKVKNFLKENKFCLLQMGIIAGGVLLLGDTSFAQTADNTFEEITGPLDKAQATISGPVAKGMATVGVACCGLATAMNMENQMVKRGMQVVGGSAAAIGGATMVGRLGDALLFL